MESFSGDLLLRVADDLQWPRPVLTLCPMALARTNTTRRECRERVHLRRRPAVILAVFFVVAWKAHGESTPLLSPAYPVPSRPMLFELEGPPIPLALCGLDLFANGEPVSTPPFQYTEGSTLTAGLHLTPTGILPTESRVRIEIEGAGPRLSKEYPLTLAGGRIGVRSLQQVQLRHGRGIVNGDATLTISYLSHGDESRPALLFAVPIHIRPRAAHSTVGDASLEGAFGPRFVRLNAAFRLGRNAAIMLNPPDGLPWKVGALGLVSATAYDPSPKRGQEICSIMCTDASGAVAVGLVKHGITTAKSDHDYYPDGALETVKLRPFSTTPASRPAADGSPFNTYMYSSVVPLSKPMMPVDITLRSVASNGVFDVKEVVLLPASDGVAP